MSDDWRHERDQEVIKAAREFVNAYDAAQCDMLETGEAREEYVVAMLQAQKVLAAIVHRLYAN